jgi:hypothetical protein
MNIAKILSDIHECAMSCGRDPAEIKLLAVTKTHSVDTIRTALESGVRYIAESKVQEAVEKMPSLSGEYAEFHFIGHLQSNKIGKLLSLRPTLIHSIDKYSTAHKLNAELAKLDRKQHILIEVNTSGEASKYGVSPTGCGELICQIDDLPYIEIRGLMTIGALSDDTDVTRRCFTTLREIYESEKTKNYKHTSMQYLSMGMSDDYHIAIEQGANILRLGSILFGERKYHG